jgi:hypothetical protein
MGPLDLSPLHDAPHILVRNGEILLFLANACAALSRIALGGLEILHSLLSRRRAAS